MGYSHLGHTDACSQVWTLDPTGLPEAEPGCGPKQAGLRHQKLWPGWDVQNRPQQDMTSWKTAILGDRNVPLNCTLNCILVVNTEKERERETERERDREREIYEEQDRGRKAERVGDVLHFSLRVTGI